MKQIEALRVNTFGGFSMEWGGAEICSSSTSSDSQFTRLMQILLHNNKQGVDRMHLQDLLFEDSRSEDVHHLLRSVIYSARKKLENAGLPKVNYIEFKDGNYCWTQEIPVHEDACEFEELYKRAKKETDPAKRIQLFMEACYCYTGDFLPKQTRLVWVAKEERRYRAIFNTCVEETAAKLREDNNWLSLEKIGTYAARVCPLNEWELLPVEAHIAMGNYKEAQTIYEETVDYYQNELGIKPSEGFIAKLHQFALRIEQPYLHTELIQEQLNEPEDEIKGGYFCTYGAFRDIYRMMSRTMDRCGRCAFLMICSVRSEGVFEEGSKAVPSEEYMSRINKRMKNIICRSVRKSDIICQYGKGQFLMILMNRTAESCKIVQDRINRNFRAGGFNLAIDYRISPVKTV